MRRITHLEDTLHGDTNGIMRLHFLQLLKQEEWRLLKKMSMPCSSDSYHHLLLCVDACENSAQVIEVLWQRYRGTQV